jgi:two-component system, OmpR family, sensor histidine kinase MtrB
MMQPTPGGRGERVSPVEPKAPSLQARLRLAVFGAALLFLLHALALGAMTRFLGKDVQYLNEAIESALVTKSIELDLMRYDRANETQFARSSATTPEAIATRLRGDLNDVRRYINNAAEEQLVDELGLRVDAYLDAHRDAHERGVSGGSARDLLAPDFAATLALTERLVDLNVEQANALLSQETAWYRIAIFVTIAAAIVVGLGLGSALLGFDRWVRRPLAAAASAIARFGAGDRDSRAAEIGPIEIREIAETFNEMAATLARQEHDRIAFIGGVAHDLRGPVSAIQMATAMLDPNGPLHGERSEATRAILARQAARLERMVGDFLDAVRIHAGHLEIKSEPVDLGELVRESVDQYRPLATDHELTAAIPRGAVMIQGDAMRLAQVLNNLLSNAVKYSPMAGPIKISLERDHGEAILAVADQGIGLQPEEHAQIFEPFRRTGASRELVPGVGLGLSIAKRIVEAHGGRIAITSTPGCGSTFRVHLPLANTESASPA